MSRLEIPTKGRSELVIEGLYRDLERRIEASPPGLCPVSVTKAFLELCRVQTCGKCVPCRIGLVQLTNLIADVFQRSPAVGLQNIQNFIICAIHAVSSCERNLTSLRRA